MHEVYLIQVYLSQAKWNQVDFSVLIALKTPFNIIAFPLVHYKYTNKDLYTQCDAFNTLSSNCTWNWSYCGEWI